METFGRTSRFIQYSSGKKAYYCKVVCDCGKVFEALEKNLKSGNTKGCGCRVSTHGLSKLPEYRIWKGIKQRCLNPRCSGYSHYGAKGITIDKVWESSFLAFYQDMGSRPSPQHSIDRYPNNQGNYEPGNCRWATPKQQRANQRPRRH
jgi:hypothetical protein